MITQIGIIPTLNHWARAESIDSQNGPTNKMIVYNEAAKIRAYR